MKSLFVIAIALTGMLLSCESSESRDARKVLTLDDDLVARLDSHFENWVLLSNAGNIEERGRTERKLRRLTDAHYSAIRLGLLSDSVRRRAVCASVIGFSLDINAVPSLLKLLGDPSKIVRGNALFSLAKIAYKRTPLDMIIPSLEDEDAVVRKCTVLCLENISHVLNEREIVKELIPCMRDADFGVRSHAAKALGSIGSMDALEVLTTHGIRDKDERVRYNSAIALARLKSYSAVDALIKVGQKEINEAVVREIVRALCEITHQNHGKDFEAWKDWWLDFKAKKKIG